MERREGWRRQKKGNDGRVGSKQRKNTGREEGRGSGAVRQSGRAKRTESAAPSETQMLSDDFFGSYFLRLTGLGER